MLDNWLFDLGWVCWESSVPPATSEPNSFIQLSLKEIFGRGRGDAIYFLVCVFSSFHHNSSWDKISWECVVKDNFVRSCLTELQSFLLNKLYVDPNTPCFDVSSPFSACTIEDRGASRSILFGSLCSLFIGSTDVKNTVCHLLKFYPPGINPEFVMECKLTAHPM